MSLYPYYGGGGYSMQYPMYAAQTQPYGYASVPYVVGGDIVKRRPAGRPPCPVHDGCTCGLTMEPRPPARKSMPPVDTSRGRQQWLIVGHSKKEKNIKSLKKEIALIQSLIPRAGYDAKRVLYEDLAARKYDLRCAEAGY